MIAAMVVEMPDPLGQLLAMFQYLLTVLAAEVTHFFITMPILFFIFTRTNPYKHMYGCLKAFGMAFASNNRYRALNTWRLYWFGFHLKNGFIFGIIKTCIYFSNMTLPLTMDCLENNLGKNPKIVRFMCPIGATVNMDGFALYETMMVIFIVQLRGMDLGFGEIITVAYVIL